MQSRSLNRQETAARDLLAAPDAAMDRGDLDQAFALFGAVLKKRKGLLRAVQGQIACLERSGRLHEAMAYCARYTSQHGTDARIAAKEGALLRQLGRYEDAQATLETAVEKTKRNPIVQLELARLFLRQGSLEAAERQFAEILARQPAHVPARLGCIAVRERQGDLSGAVALCEAASQPVRDDIRIAVRFGELLRRRGDFTDSREILTSALESNPQHTATIEELARTLLASGQINAAETRFTDLLRMKPGYRPALFGCVSCALRRGDPSAARALLLDQVPDAIASEDDAEIGLRLLEAGLNAIEPETTESLTRTIRDGIGTLSATQLKRLAEFAVAWQNDSLLAICIEKLSLADRLPFETCAFLIKRALQTAPVHLVDLIEPALLEKSDPSNYTMVRAEYASFRDGPDAALAILRAHSKSPRRPREARAVARYLAQAGNKRVQRRYLRWCDRRWPKTAWVQQALFQAHHACGDPGAAHALLDRWADNHSHRRLRKLRVIDLLHQADPFAAYSELKVDYTPGDPIVGLSTWFQLAVNTGDVATAERLLPAMRSRTDGTSASSSHFLSSQLGARYNELVLLEHARSSSGVSMDEFAPRVVANYSFAAIKVLHDAGANVIKSAAQNAVPRQIFQYWDRSTPPDQITRLMDGWRMAEGFAYRRFDRRTAQAYLRATFGSEYARAFASANHVSEESDFFRLCVLLAEGGIYVDADDRRHSHPDALLAEASGLILFREDFGALANNTICAPPGHPVLVRAVEMVVPSLLARESENTWSKTGPGLLTRAAAAHYLQATKSGEDPEITILPFHRLLRHTSPHVRVPYKNTSKYWGNKGVWSTSTETAAWKRFVKGNPK